MLNESKEDSGAYRYDVCLSFAGENRDLTESVASALKESGARVFYDEFEKSELWGKDLYSHFDFIYRKLARYCMIFISEDYAEKVWTNHERRSAQARALEENQEYILPVRLDDTEIPGLPDTIGYLDLREISIDELIEIAQEKIHVFERRNYFPPNPDRLTDYLKVPEEAPDDIAVTQARVFWEVLGRMNEDEREAVFRLFLHGCPAELPDNVHINLDLLRRVTDRSIAELKEIFGNLRSLGFLCTLREGHHEDDALGGDEFLVVEWHPLKKGAGQVGTDAAQAMVRGATQGLCADHGLEALKKMNFAQLSSATETDDEHGEEISESGEEPVE